MGKKYVKSGSSSSVGGGSTVVLEAIIVRVKCTTGTYGLDQNQIYTSVSKSNTGCTDINRNPHLVPPSKFRQEF